MATAKTNYWKWGVLVAAGIALFLFGRSCGIGSVIKSATNDTVIYRDSIIREYRPYPVNYVTAGTEKVIYKPLLIRDTTFQYDVLIEPADTAAILSDYYATRYYSDTQHLKRGRVIIQDSVTQNRIASRKLEVTGVDTTITKTVTLKPPKKLVGYFTLSAAGNRHEPLGSAGAGFMLKMPDETMVGVQYRVTRLHRPMYEVQVGLPLRPLKWFTKK